MNILILSNNDIGLYKFRKELIEILIEYNNELYLVMPYGRNICDLSRIGCHCINVKLDRRGINPIKDLKLLLDYAKIIKKVKPDMILTYTIKPNIYGGLLSRFLGIDYAVNVTGLGTAFQKKGIIQKTVIYLYKFALGKAKTVFFENSDNKDFFVRNKMINISQGYVLNGAGVNLDYFKFKNYPQHDNRVISFIFIGRIMQEKGIEELFGAIKKINEKNTRCILNLLGEYEEDYQFIISEYEAKGWINYYGYKEDVRELVEESDCLILPSWHEGMANVNLEAAALGRPIITSDIPGCREAVIEGETGFLCKPQNTESLYETMKKFIDLSYEERKNMGYRARIHMEKNFDRKKVVENTINKLFK